MSMVQLRRTDDRRTVPANAPANCVTFSLRALSVSWSCSLVSKVVDEDSILLTLLPQASISFCGETSPI
jgi:hypothetical protein